MDAGRLHTQLFALQDPVYLQMQRRLIPNIDPETIIGVRTPDLRRIAKDMRGEGAFLRILPHRYFEENQLHSFLLAEEKDFLTAVEGVDAFLPYIDNWAVCDQLRPKVFAKHHTRLLPYIQKWITSDHPYTIRFGLSMLMCHFLDADFSPVYLEWAATVRSDHYYVKMMVAWYFATALAKQYESAVPYITGHRLEPWTHNKTIQKSVESFRVPEGHKAELKQYRK